MSTVFPRSKAPRTAKEPIRETIIASEPVVPSVYFRWRGVLHWITAAFLLLLAAPIILVAIVAVFLTSPGSAVYKQRRVGKNGRIFTLYKIRSMRADAEARHRTHLDDKPPRPAHHTSWALASLHAPGRVAAAYQCRQG